MEKKILPVAESPVKGFSHQAALLSILLGHKECWEWICNNYIQLFSLRNLDGKRSGTLDFYYMDYGDFRAYEYIANPWIRHFGTPLNMINMDNLERLLIDQLEKNFYIQVEVDEYYIHSYDAYERGHAIHWIYIYGYDKANHIFFCMDNFKNSKFVCDSIPSYELLLSIKENYNSYLKKLSSGNNMTAEEKNGPSIYMFQILPYLADPENKEVLSINIRRMISLLKNYLHIGFQYLAYGNSQYYVFGIEVYSSLQKYLISKIRKGENIDIRGFYSLMDHKALMLWRMKFLLENKYITTSQISSLNDTIDNYNLLVLNKMRIQINLLLKYRIKNDNRYLYKVISELDSIKENEIHILTKFIDLLEQSCHEQENRNVNKEC